MDKNAMGKISAYGIEVKLKYQTMKQPRGSQDKCVMEMIVEGSGMCNKDLVSFNIPRKRQQAIFLLDISTAKGDKIDKLLMSDWQETHKGSLGKNISTIIFGLENLTKEDWTYGGGSSAKYTPQHSSCSLCWTDGTSLGACVEVLL